jgi:hypothetical protein
MTIIIAILAAFIAGFAVARMGTAFRISQIEARFRDLANGVSIYTSLDRCETLPAEWVQEQLDGFIREEFR